MRLCISLIGLAMLVEGTLVKGMLVEGVLVDLTLVEAKIAKYLAECSSHSGKAPQLWWGE